jgi:lipopolysaccharide biosynthesis glycosyltransferase
VPIKGLVLNELRSKGLYDRPTEVRDGRLWDVISQAPMATEFAISRFLVPYLARKGWAIFVDADVMARVSLTELFAQADRSKACMVVKHNHNPNSMIKMDGQIQTAYARKNWSSVVLWNCEHPRTRLLTPDVVNRERGLWLHQFSWLGDNDIGELDPAWNHLVGEMPRNPRAKLVHFTTGTPNIKGYEHCEFADEWRAQLQACGT